MKKGIIVKSIAVYVFIFCTCVSCSTWKDDFEEIKSMVSPYSESETSEYTYDISGEKFTIDSDISSLKIIRGNSKNIQVSMDKKISGDNDDKLKEELNNIRVSYEDGKLNIEVKMSSDSTNLNKIDTTIKLPLSIKDIKMDNSVGDVRIDGDYDKVDSRLEIGDFYYIGKLKEGNVEVDTGDIDLKLNKIEENYKYNVIGKIGDINIHVPDGSKIDLIGEVEGEVKFSKGITLKRNSARFNVKTNVGDIEISN